MACLEILTNTISPEDPASLAIWASHLALIALAVLSFRDVLGIARTAMENRAAFSRSSRPFQPLAGFRHARDGVGGSSSRVWDGTMASVFVLDVAFPMIYTSIAVDMAGNLGGGDRASGVASMLRQAAFLGTGVLMACFVGAVAGQRAAPTGRRDGFQDRQVYERYFHPSRGETR